MLVQITMMLTIKCNDALNFNGTYLDYGSELCFVIVFQISSLFLGMSIYMLDTYWESWVHFWLDSDIKFILSAILGNLLVFVLPILG